MQTVFWCCLAYFVIKSLGALADIARIIESQEDEQS